ncbi:MAG: EMC3/TMCO1 family protein [Candidatus Bathyarchaeia archaeon]|jgi:uncharacterized membrane protein (DUF106 family)
MFQAFLDIPLKSVPFSTVFILSLSAAISLLTTLVNRRFTNPEKSRAWRKEISDWNKDLRAARGGKDKKTLEKVMKKQQYIMQLQSKMMWQSMKVSLLFLVPLFLMWQILGGFYGPAAIAYLPGMGNQLVLPILNIAFSSLFWWYLLCSLLFGTAFQHVFRLIEVSE